jgi:2-polyprenyl-3-methyl-5-hydroxy-6-metoxy-1,4-benzoquinol methylase
MRLFSWIVNQISPKYKSLLDAGCGKGAFLRFVLGSIDTPIHLVGVDYTANSPFFGIEYQQGELENLPRDQRFDVVVSLAVIEHVADPVAFAGELYERCEVGGLVIVMTLNNDSFLYGVARLMAKFKISGPCDRLYSAHHTQHFTTKSLRQTLEKNNLEIIKIHYHNAPIAALDIPARNIIVRLLYKAGVIVLLWAGLLFCRTSLQTIVARRNS